MMRTFLAEVQNFLKVRSAPLNPLKIRLSGQRCENTLLYLRYTYFNRCFHVKIEFFIRLARKLLRTIYKQQIDISISYYQSTSIHAHHNKFIQFRDIFKFRITIE